MKVYWDLKDKLKELTIHNVKDSGGAINFSGIYPLNPTMDESLEENLREDRLRLIGVSS